MNKDILCDFYCVSDNKAIASIEIHSAITIFFVCANHMAHTQSESLLLL